MKKLRWISLYNYPASSFPSNFQPRELGCLELQFSRQKELWHGYKSLPNLKILNLSDSKNLIKTPDIEGLPCLERLILEGCWSLEEIHPSIGYHKRLVYVDMSVSWTTPRSQVSRSVMCWNLVELPDLPSSIAILKADGCDSLESVGDLSYYKWLWKVSLWGCYKLIGGERVLHSMLEGNAAKDRFMSVLLPAVEPSSCIFARLVTLQLPSNWYSDFSGLLLFLRDHSRGKLSYRIDIKQETSTYDYSKESDEDWKQCKYERVGYVPFNSLRHIPWLNPTYTKNILFQTDKGGLNVELVRSKNKIVDLNENPINYSECWDEEYKDAKTFEIMYDSQPSNIRIVWNH
ncbi:uncharacterized protein LOC110871753 [Helianthus annuus]|uniref:uncharacterized protein LOC110871753 n=1 Tax=Helianthus annuus TaxID=4232 RepID=UPI000B8FB6DA|nr:uncharacterized protein LOC110871753 [Helianthus annuus]